MAAACAASRSATPAGATLVPSAAPAPQLLLATTKPPAVEVWELHFAQSLGIDAPFESVELLVSSRAPTPRARLVLTERPDSAGTKRQVQYADGELCFERSEGTTTTFHVQADTPAGALDWRFEWPESGARPANAGAALRFLIGLYEEPSKPIAVGAAAR